MENKLFITDTILRDAHQSQAATRMRLDDMLPACKTLDKIGYWSLECWGGATFDSCMRFLDEDPWERLRRLRAEMPNTKLQMLLRGQNLLGYKHYSDDVVDLFVKKAIENGIDVIRVFDALNDPRNLEASVKAIKKYGGICECAFSYTKSPVHNEEYFVNLALTFQEMGADVICIKDMANLLLPYEAYSLIKKLKDALGISDRYTVQLVLAIGKSAEEAHIVDVDEGADMHYYRVDGVHYVPKRKLENLIIHE